jgi:transcriptional regulator with GAF, ATPase, and Fis domain
MTGAVVFEAMRLQAALSHRLAARRVGAWELVERIGEGATAVVWKAREQGSDRVAALKLARDDPGGVVVAREAALLARVKRRWGPAILDAGPGFLAAEWVEGAAVEPEAPQADRQERAAVLAHAIGRALEELHEAGVVHGDVKPANVLASLHRPARDAADDRGASLVDLGLAYDAGSEAQGGTSRYAAPELREHAPTGPAADLWALGVLLAEVLDPRVARAPDARAAVARWSRDGTSAASPRRGQDLDDPSADSPRRGRDLDDYGEPHRWVEALLASAPGGRPSAGWLADRAARWLNLRHDEEEAARARVERVRRSYMAERRREIAPGASVSEEVGGTERAWLEEAVALAERLAPAEPLARAPEATRIGPLGPLRRARWLVSLVGPSAAHWPLGGDESEGDLVARALELARLRAPASWTLDDLARTGPTSPDSIWDAGTDEPREERLARLVRELARPRPHPTATALAEDDVARGRAPTALALHLAASLLRSGETGRAWASLSRAEGAEADAMRAETARRRGDVAEARRAAGQALADRPDHGGARATLARLAWDAGDLDGADLALDGATGPAAAEVRALVAWRRGAFDSGLRALEPELARPLDADVYARLAATLGLLELARGSGSEAARAFGRAVELAARAGAVVEEATYLTSEAAATADAGEMGRALACATRAGLLWERLGRPALAARAWLARAAALATMGAAHATDEAAEEAWARAQESRDAQAAAYARWAQVEVRAPGDERARAWAIEADAELARGEGEDRTRAVARLLVWAPDVVDEARVAEGDALAPTLGAAARWEWWGARAAAILMGRKARGDAGVLPALLALLDAPAPLGSRGPAVQAAQRLAVAQGDGDAARRLDQARMAAARLLRDGTPPEHRASLASVAWARVTAIEASDVAFQPAQVAQLESIVRALSTRDRLKPLLEQVLDTMILWAGVERGLLLLRAPDGKLVPRAARNLAREDLSGDQLALSQTIARRALADGEAVVATDAFSTLGELHASVHALRLRSVLAVPLVARGEALGVVYLDDRVRKGAFGARELAWVRVVASQAAMAIADARDAVRLRRAARHAERARARVEGLLSEREAELDVTKTQLALARDQPEETRYRYDRIIGRSEPIRDLLRLVDRVTASDVPVLIVGESGTGKELVARAMHENGPRARRAFVSENCASVPEPLLESTLFGHVKGAFTGAASARPGLFEVADGGTLFLDEIGEMPLTMQVKLLRVLQDGEVRAVGGARVRTVNVRVIGATHRDLEALVAAGSFREDLLYRLNVVTLRVPALRDRPEDVPLLVEHFVRKHTTASDKKVRVTRAAMARLAAFPWPGNVRQLENEIRRALVLGEGAIDVGDLSQEVARGAATPRASGGLHLRTRVDALEAELVQEALAKTRGNQTKAAHLLGLSRFGLQKMVKRLGIKPAT